MMNHKQHNKLNANYVKKTRGDSHLSPLGEDLWKTLGKRSCTLTCILDRMLCASGLEIKKFKSLVRQDAHCISPLMSMTFILNFFLVMEDAASSVGKALSLLSVSVWILQELCRVLSLISKTAPTAPTLWVLKLQNLYCSKWSPEEIFWFHNIRVHC